LLRISLKLLQKNLKACGTPTSVGQLLELANVSLYEDNKDQMSLMAVDGDVGVAV
jgi:hypothetical protein